MNDVNNQAPEVDVEGLFIDAQMNALEILKTNRAEIKLNGVVLKLRIFMNQPGNRKTIRYNIKCPSKHAAERFAKRIANKYPSNMKPDPQGSLFDEKKSDDENADK